MDSDCGIDAIVCVETLIADNRLNYNLSTNYLYVYPNHILLSYIPKFKLFYDYLEEFCRHLQQAQDKEEILLKKPWTDEDKNITYFRLKDFENFLKKNKYFEFKSHKIAQRLRDINGESIVLKIKNRSVRVWSIPSFDVADVDISAPDFHQEEVPF